MDSSKYSSVGVSKVVGDLTLYAYRVVDIQNPTEEDLLWLQEGDAIPEGFEEYTMQVNSAGTDGSVGKGPYATCYVCRYDYPITSMIKKGNRYYCIPQRCYEDLV